MGETILVINAGSSSIKFQLFANQQRDTLERRLRGQVEGIGSRPRLLARAADGTNLADREWESHEVGDGTAAIRKIAAFLREHVVGEFPTAVGHRVVHGGTMATPLAVTPESVEQLERLVSLAPLHQPNNLAPIRVIMERFPHVTQVACFDTAFHRTHSEIADTYALPERFYQEGIRRYGFHGLSYEYIASQLPDVAPDIAGGRVIVAHLGSGASMCALRDGRSLESTMGFTALDGLPMGTRPGQLDPGVVLHLLDQKGMTAEALQQFLYNECGLKGLSGISNDMRVLLSSPEPRAKFAINYFVYRAALATGMLASALGGIDGFVFTAGVGENSPIIREAIARKIEWLGLKLDVEANAAAKSRISRVDSKVPCYVIPTDEELVIARHTLHALRGKTS
jgi:acetate kinase